MQFTCSVEINKDQESVSQLFLNPNYFHHWQDGFIAFRHLDNNPASVGSKTLLTYQIGKNILELTETIRLINLPNEFKAEYDCKPMCNDMNCEFKSLGNNKTLLIQDIHYTRISGIIPNIMAFFFPKMFKKQVDKWLIQFKDFAESYDPSNELD